MTLENTHTMLHLAALTALASWLLFPKTLGSIRTWFRDLVIRSVILILKRVLEIEQIPALATPSHSVGGGKGSLSHEAEEKREKKLKDWVKDHLAAANCSRKEPALAQ